MTAVPIGLNEVVDRGINVAVQRRLGLSSLATLSLMPELATTLDLGPQPELIYNLGWRRMGHFLNLAQTVGQRGHWRFRVQQKVNALVVLEGIFADGDTTTSKVFIDVGSFSADLANPFPIHVGRDFRQANPSGTLANGSVVTLSTAIDGTAATLGVYGTWNVPGTETGVPLPGTVDLVLADGLGIEVDCQNVNQPLNIAVYWRERRLNDQEDAR